MTQAFIARTSERRVRSVTMQDMLYVFHVRALIYQLLKVVGERMDNVHFSYPNSLHNQGLGGVAFRNPNIIVMQHNALYVYTVMYRLWIFISRAGVTQGG